MEKYKKKKENATVKPAVLHKKSPKISVSDEDVAMVLKRLKLPSLTKSSKLDCVGSQNSKISFETLSP